MPPVVVSVDVQEGRHVVRAGDGSYNTAGIHNPARPRTATSAADIRPRRQFVEQFDFARRPAPLSPPRPAKDNLVANPLPQSIRHRHPILGEARHRQPGHARADENPHILFDQLAATTAWPAPPSGAASSGGAPHHSPETTTRHALSQIMNHSTGQTRLGTRRAERTDGPANRNKTPHLPRFIIHHQSEKHARRFRGLASNRRLSITPIVTRGGASRTPAAASRARRDRARANSREPSRPARPRGTPQIPDLQRFRQRLMARPLARPRRELLVRLNGVVWRHDRSPDGESRTPPPEPYTSIRRAVRRRFQRGDFQNSERVFALDERHALSTNISLPAAAGRFGPGVMTHPRHHAAGWTAQRHQEIDEVPGHLEKIPPEYRPKSSTNAPTLPRHGLGSRPRKA